MSRQLTRGFLRMSGPRSSATALGCAWLGQGTARALSTRDLSPDVSFVDVGGNGYATVRVSPNVLETEFVCIERPIARSTTPGGGRRR